jgi:drug/metabolite transporter (DMT)-like permease
LAGEFMIAESSPEGLTVGLVLLAALLHASWNALVKASGDPFVNIAIVTATGGLVAIPALFLFPVPGPETWPWLVLSAFVHYAYQLSLVRMYQLGDLSQVYPIARGLAPLGVGVLAAVGAGEGLAPLQLLGLVLASVAIMALSGLGSRGPSSRGAVGMALVTAALIGLYTFSDGRGVRSVEDPIFFIGWSFVLGSVPMVLTTILVRGRDGWAAVRASGLRAVGGGIMATIGYGIVLWAMSRTTMASVAALRESSVLFAALLGTRLLGEPFGRRRAIAALVLVVGLVLIQMTKAAPS